jgi:hypothetical protein
MNQIKRQLNEDVLSNTKTKQIRSKLILLSIIN